VSSSLDGWQLSAVEQLSAWRLQQLTSRTSSTFDPGDVVEHQPRSCSQVQSSGGITFSKIVIEVDYQRVETPLWVAKQENPTGRLRRRRHCVD
jgi:hypothetical protein